VLQVGRIGRIILNGQLFQGDGFGAGEIGHIRFLPEGDLCRCGNRGCIETVGSTLAVIHRLQAVRAGEAPNMEEITNALEAGDSLVHQVVAEAGRAVGFGVACLVSSLNLRHVLLVGSGTRFGEPWSTPFARRWPALFIGWLVKLKSHSARLAPIR
jgi:predicted NBD/HSP70 family sugar kinase